MHVTLLTDGVNRAGVCASGAIDTLVINCVSHGIFLLFDRFMFQKLWGVYRKKMILSRANRQHLFLKKLAIYDTLHYASTSHFAPVTYYKS